MNLSRPLVLLAFVCVGPAVAAEPIGNATSAVPAATYAHGGPSQELQIGAALQQNDRIRTDANGAAEIEFIDGTSITIGANSEVVLDKMIFDGDKARNATLQIVKGTFRFVTGASDHNAYQIKTPVATIGVRGTVIDISLEKGDMVFNTVEGIGVVCQGGANCRDIRAGEQPVAVNRTGFRIATAAQAARLTRIVTGAHTNLSRRIGRDPRMGKGFQKRSDRLDRKGFDKRGGIDRKNEKFGEKNKFGGKDAGKFGGKDNKFGNKDAGKFGEKGGQFGQGHTQKPSFGQRLGEGLRNLKNKLPARRKDERERNK